MIYTWSSRWYFRILWTGFSRYEPKGRERFRAACRSLKNLAKVLLLMQSVSAATELQAGNNGTYEIIQAGYRTSMMILYHIYMYKKKISWNNLLGVVVAILGVDFKVFTLGTETRHHLCGFPWQTHVAFLVRAKWIYWPCLRSTER